MINIFKTRKVIQPLLKPDLQEINQNPENKKREGPLKDQVFVFTGVFDSFDRVEAEELVKSYGARVTSSISGRTTQLVHSEILEDGRNQKEGRKYKSAIEKENIKIISEDDYRSLLVLKCNWTDFKHKKSGDGSNPNTINQDGSAKTITVTINQGDKVQNVERVVRTGDTSWIEKYKPARLEDLVGNNNIAQYTHEQCKNWYDMFISKVYNKSNLPGTVNNKALLLIGPCGVGKTSIVQLICNKLDQCLFKLTLDKLTCGKDLLNSPYINLAFGNCIIDKYGTNIKRALILIEDIDGLGENDNGVISTLCELIPRIRHPIVLTAESANISKMKKLLKSCQDLRLKVPNKQQVAKFLFRIVKHENLTADGNALEEIVERSNHDIRASIINLQLHTTLIDSLKLEQLSLNCFKSPKTGQSVQDIASQFLNGQIYDTISMNEKMDAFKDNQKLLPNLIFENYLEAFGEIQVSGDQNRLADVAEFCALGDYIDKFSRSNDNQHSLTNDQGVVSCLTTSCQIKGVITTVQFPKVFLDTQEQCKNRLDVNLINQQMNERHLLINHSDIVTEYIPYFNHVIFTHLIQNSIHSVSDVAGLLSDSGLTFDSYKHAFNNLEWKNESPEQYLQNNFNYENKKPLLNKFLLVDNDTLNRVKRKIAIEGDIIDKHNPSVTKLKQAIKTKNNLSKLNVHKNCDRFLNDAQAEELVLRDVVGIEKGHYKVYKKPTTVSDKIKCKRKRL